MQRRLVIASWAVLGVIGLLFESVARMSRIALSATEHGLTPAQWAAFGAATVAMGYVEGYRAFSCTFGPRVVARAFALAAKPTGIHVALAPLYAMSLVGDERPRVLRSWALVGGIVMFVILVRQLPPTWRGIIDGAVALSLAWGVIVLSLLWARGIGRELRASS